MTSKRYSMNINSVRRRAGSLTTALLILCVLLQAGCAPTYPKEIVDEAIVQLCREEYSVDVKVKVLGKTIGVYIPLEGLFDQTLNISQEAADKINNVILSVSRVTLSTDAPIDFYIVIAQDPMLPEIEVVVVRYVADIKMLHYSQISRGEFAKRMIIEVKLTPQAQRERVLRDIFGRLNIEQTDELVAEYLATSEVASIGDMGYWNDNFYIKEIEKEEFLALQMAERSKARLVTDPSFIEKVKLEAINGEFLKEGGKAFFRITFSVSASEATGLFIEDDKIDKVFEVALGEAADVLHGYKFKDFWNIEIVDSNTGQLLFATGEELEEFRKKKIQLEELRRWYR